jgi:PIN domain nuclease of toxin-antitoxin system
MSTVNLAEAIGRFVRVGIDEQRARRLILRSTIEFVDFTVERAVSTAKLLPRTSRFGLSLGDRACLALAIERGVPVMTADRAWADLDIGVPVTVIR